MILFKIYPQIETYYDHKLDDYITSKKKWLFLQKLSGGKCANPIKYYPLSINNVSISHPDYPYTFEYNNTLYSSLNHCIKNNLNKNISEIVLHYYNTNKEAVLILTEQIMSSYIIDNDIYNIGNILTVNRHYLFVIKYFNIFKYEH